jgi:glyceraldehyde-3-phosphate dehydrogenase type II
MMSKNVLVVGTGTIGEPLIGLLAVLKKDLDIDEVAFYKRTPLIDEFAKVESLCKKGAQLIVKDNEFKKQFEHLGHKVSSTFEEALNQAGVVIDCTPAGNHMKDVHYLGLDASNSKKRLFVAQGSEKGFGIPYAYGINDQILDDAVNPRFIQVVSCNTHNIACLLQTLSGAANLICGDFTCMRRANDISQDGSFIASPTVESHKHGEFGTHHARDVYDLFKTIGRSPNIFSSALKLNTQYMHMIRFNITLEGEITRGEVLESLLLNKFVALTHKMSANKVFSFGRDHGFYGRTYNQTVVPVPALHVSRESGNTHIVGLCFTPQDGNSLLSSIAAALYGLHGEKYTKYLPVLDQTLFEWI